MNLWHKGLITFILLSILLASRATSPTTEDKAGLDSLILSEQEDPLYPLAEEIASTESLPVFHNWHEALQNNPSYILWVISPHHLSDTVIIEAAIALRKHAFIPAIGLISGNTLEEARNLWQRKAPFKASVAYTAIGEYPSMGIHQAHLSAVEHGKTTQPTPMTKSSLVNALQHADYLVFTGHGSATSWYLDTTTSFRAEDIPSLPPLVIASGSCQSFRLWVKDSIAMTFAKNGAAAYAGFVFSPLAGATIGNIYALPFEHTWQGFPIGMVISLQNRATLKLFARIPYYFLLGDPRIAFRILPPYTLVADIQSGEERTLSYSNAPPGIIPVVIVGGAEYQFIHIDGVGAIAETDPINHIRLQTMNLKGDKYLLFAHNGGEFTVHLRRRAPFLWQFSNTIRNAFDLVHFIMPQNGGDIILLLCSLITLAGILKSRQHRQKIAGEQKSIFLLSCAVAGVFLISATIYQVTRLDQISILHKPVYISPIWLAAIFLLTGSATYLHLSHTAWIAKVLSSLLATLPALLPALFNLSTLLIFNLFFSMPRLGTPIASYHLGTLPLVSAGVWYAAFELVTRVTQTALSSSSKNKKFGEQPLSG
ncbi:MAG: hypothetical protein HPY45_00570 [Anaerolineae bacterium]|nr:hypothetical protein [Anaerolineae bacterium]